MHNYSSSIMMLNICSAPTAHHQMQHTNCSRMIDDEWTTELPPVSVRIIVVFFFSNWNPVREKPNRKTEPNRYYSDIFFDPKKTFFDPKKVSLSTPKKFFFDPKKIFFWGRKKFWVQKKKLKNIYCLSLTIHTVK